MSHGARLAASARPDLHFQRNLSRRFRRLADRRRARSGDGPKSAERFATSLLPTAGALFIGSSTPTALGDYLAGPNHVLPTGGAARSFSGLSVRDFLRWGRSVKVPESAARRLAPPAAVLARFEGLAAHAAALDRRAP